MEAKVNSMSFKFFSSADYRDALDRYTAEVVKTTVKVSRTNPSDTINIFAYFNDKEDTYRLTIVGRFGDVIRKDCYSWDEVSTIIYENL